MRQVPSFSVALVMMAACASCALGQEAATTQAVDAGAAPSDVVVKTLKVLENRPSTLKDFQADVKYNVVHPRTGDEEGKVGTVDFVNDPAGGPSFAVHFTHDTVDEKVIKAHKQDVLFDGKSVTLIDYRGKKFDRSTLASSPGGTASLTNPVVLPIGLKTEEVLGSFDVTEVPADATTPAGATVLKLVPKKAKKGSFDFKSLVLTVDSTSQLPVKVVRTEKNNDETTVSLENVKVNGGTAKMTSATPPTEAGWDVSLK